MLTLNARRAALGSALLCVIATACGSEVRETGPSGPDKLDDDLPEHRNASFCPVDDVAYRCEDENYTQFDVFVGCGLERYASMDDSYTWEFIYTDRATDDVVYHAVKPDTGGGCDVYADETNGVPECDSWKRQRCPDQTLGCHLVKAEYRCQDSVYETFEELSGCGMTLTQTYIDNGETHVQYTETSTDQLKYRAYLSQFRRCEADFGPLSDQPACDSWQTNPCPRGSTRVEDIGVGGANGLGIK